MSDLMQRRRHPVADLVLLTLLAAGGALAHADDPDNCLLCHQYRGLSRYEPSDGSVHVFYASPEYQLFRLGAHARIACTDCHAREEVSVIPHQPVSRVDCTRTCHLHDVSGLARQFSHHDMALMLERSVHRPEILANLPFTDGPLLRPGQSACLNCHDEPLYRDPTELIPTLDVLGGHAVDRCAGCHEVQLPTDTQFYLRHVTSRLQRARPTLEQAQVCGVCHADAAIVAAQELPNSVASFMRSFHGKAALLGVENAASCVSCHVLPGRDTHLILARDDPQSSINPAHVADSCRSTACHPGADPSLASTGVHLDLPTERRTLEFALAAAFIVLTLVSFGPSLVLCLMELAQIVVGREHHASHAAHQLVLRVLAHPGGRARLTRFTINQRYQHWLLAVLFALLALTGFPMKFADQHWAAVVIANLGGLAVARDLHHWAGISLVLGFVAHGVYAIVTMLKRARERTPAGARRGLSAALWDLPMLIQPRDLAKFNQLMLYLFGLRRDPPTFGRFTVKEKFEYFGVFWGVTLLGVTGLVLWQEQYFSRFIAGRVFNIALIAHTYEAFLAIIHVGILHIVNVVFSPHVFPLSRATLTGVTPVSELADQHREFVEDAARDLGLATGGPAHE